MAKEYWITNSRFKYIGLLLLIIFLVFMTFLYLKSEEITKDPCSICAGRMDSEVKCKIVNTNQELSRSYFPNGTIINAGGNIYSNKLTNFTLP